MALAVADVLRLLCHPSICLSVSLSPSLSLCLFYCLFVFSVLPGCSVSCVLPLLSCLSLCPADFVSENVQVLRPACCTRIYCIYKHITNAPRARSLPQGCAASACRTIPSSRIKRAFRVLPNWGRRCGATSCRTFARAALSLARSVSRFLFTFCLAALQDWWSAELRCNLQLCLQLTIWITHCSFLAAIYCHSCCCCCCCCGSSAVSIAISQAVLVACSILCRYLLKNTHSGRTQRGAFKALPQQLQLMRQLRVVLQTWLTSLGPNSHTHTCTHAHMAGYFRFAQLNFLLEGTTWRMCNQVNCSRPTHTHTQTHMP